MAHDAMTTGDLAEGMRTDQLSSDELIAAHDQLHYMFRAERGDRQLTPPRLPQIVRLHARMVVELGKRGMSHPPPPDDGLDATVAAEAIAKVSEETRQTGIMVTFDLAAEDAEALSIEGGEPPEDLHLTLAFLGTTIEAGKDDDLYRRSVERAVARAVRGHGDLSGAIAGFGVFTGGEEPVLVALFDSPQLPALRESIVDALDKAGVEVKRNHGFTPHITLAIGNIPLPDDFIERTTGSKLTFTNVSVHVGNTTTQVSLAKALSAAPAPLGSGVMEPVNIVVPITKVDAEQRIATGVVLEPDSVDAQNDTISAEEIASAAYRFLANHQSTTQLGIQHEIFGQIGVELYESWIAKTDFILGAQQVTKGSWLMSIHASSDTVWRKIKSGEITGFSIGGEASRSR